MPVNGSQREGCKRLLAKVNGVDAQVQQEVPPSPFFLADSLAAVPQAESSLPCLFLKVNEFLSFREGKASATAVRRRGAYLRCWVLRHPGASGLWRWTALAWRGFPLSEGR